MSQRMELDFSFSELHSVMLNSEKRSYICFGGESYTCDGEPVELLITFRDIDFLQFISHRQIDEIKENLKKRIDQL